MMERSTGTGGEMTTHSNRRALIVLPTADAGRGGYHVAGDR